MSPQGTMTATFNLVSPEFPSGVAWLVNCLLELGVAVWDPWGVNIPNEWQQTGPQTFRYNDDKQNWQQTLPSLLYGREFHFYQSQVAGVSHQWPLTLASNKPLLFFVRDPRDQLHSQWRRNKHNLPGYEQDLSAFVDDRYHHYPLSNQEYLLLFYHLWQNQLQQADHLVLRFEDYRTKPMETLKQVITYLNLSVEKSQLENALTASDFEVCQQIEAQLAAQGNLERRFNFAGQAFEYKEHGSASQHFELSDSFHAICQWLDYEGPKPVEGVDKRSLEDREINQIMGAIYHGTRTADKRLFEAMKKSNLTHDWRYLS